MLPVKERSILAHEHAERLSTAVSLARSDCRNRPNRGYRSHLRESKASAPDQLPLPELDAHAIAVEEFRAYTPDQSELWAGYLFDTSQHTPTRRRLLHLLPG